MQLPVDYLAEFPIVPDLLPAHLRQLLMPGGLDPEALTEVSLHFEADPYGLGRERAQMVMAVMPEAVADEHGIPSAASDGVVAYSTPEVREMGGLADYTPSVSGSDYIVASWGSGSFYSFALAEKVWMALGLSSRALGAEQQRMVYDDLGEPEFGVASGELSTQYYFTSKRNVRWTMRNDYLRRYLWMRGQWGVRIFFYEARLSDAPHLRALMNGEAHANIKPKNGWYEFDIQEFNGDLLIKVWGKVFAIAPVLCLEQTADGLAWPGVEGLMTHARANALVNMTVVYLDDRFLERYEQNSLFDTVPVNTHGRWLVSPSYLGEWSFSECQRVGRNMLRVPMRELYKPKPDREILHAHRYVLSVEQVVGFDRDEEHFPSKVNRLVEELLELGDNLSVLANTLGIEKSAEEIVGLDEAQIRANGWLKYPELAKLAQVVPLTMTEQAFLSRCKSIHELWQRIPNAFLRTLIEAAGHNRKDAKDLASIKLLQALTNILERLNAEGEDVTAFDADATSDELTRRNPSIAPLFLNNELRIADAHDAGGVLRILEAVQFDVGGLNDGYGYAIDHIIDAVTEAFAHINNQLDHLLYH